MTRWWPVLGGMLMNLALGSLYAWSVFVLPLEKEFGWSHRRNRKRIRICGADTGRLEMVPRPSRACRRADGRRLRRRLGDLRACRNVAHRRLRLARDVPDSRRGVSCHDRDRGAAAQE